MNNNTTLHIESQQLFSNVLSDNLKPDFVSPGFQVSQVLDLYEITSHVGSVTSVASLFDCAGVNKLTLYCADCGRMHVVSLCCGSRLCVTCRRKGYSRMLAEWLPRLESVPSERMVLITLTRRIVKGGRLREKVEETKKKFAKLLRQKWFASGVKGGLYVYEVSLKPAGWYVHMHAVVEAAGMVCVYRDGKGREKCDIRKKGTFISMQKLSAAWKMLTGDSYIVDMSPVSSQKKAFKYVLKYLLKSPSGLSSSDDVSAQSYQDALFGKRLVQSFGTWHKSHDEYRFSDVKCEKKTLSCEECGCEKWYSEHEISKFGVVNGVGWSFYGGLSPPVLPQFFQMSLLEF